LKVLRLFTDGAARGNPGPAALGVVIEDADGMRLAGRQRYLGVMTNNRAEYLALIEGLRMVSEWHPDRVEVFLDSKLVVEQLAGRFRVKNAELAPLHQRALELLASFPDISLSHVERDRNRGADGLANRALDEQKQKAAGRG
jgi:ribonuclease HI